MITWAATKGYIDGLEENDVRPKIDGFLSYIRNNKIKVANEINSKKELTDVIKDTIDNECKEYFK